MFPVILDDVRRKAYYQKIIGLDRNNLIGYWPMGEASGGDAFDLSPEGNDGAYTGVTLGQVGIGDGKTCPLFDGANDFNNVYSTAFNTDFDGEEGTILLWIKVANAGVWLDGTVRYPFQFQVDGSNKMYIRRNTTNNELKWTYTAGGAAKDIIKGSVSSVDWMHLAVTWSKSANEMIAYVDGVQEGSIQTGLGTFVGSLSSTKVCFGSANTTPDAVWDGYLAHAAVWKVPLVSGKILKAATV